MDLSPVMKSLFLGILYSCPQWSRNGASSKSRSSSSSRSSNTYPFSNRQVPFLPGADKSRTRYHNACSIVEVLLASTLPEPAPPTQTRGGSASCRPKHSHHTYVRTPPTVTKLPTVNRTLLKQAIDAINPGLGMADPPAHQPHIRCHAPQRS